MRPSAGQRGFTLLETLTALALLGLGAAAVWYLLGASNRLERRAQAQQTALDLALSEMESLRLHEKRALMDTAYERDAGPGRYRVERDVLDSAQIWELVPEVSLDERLSPLHLRRPLEVRVSVRRLETDVLGIATSDREPLVSLFLLLPEYQWY